MRYRLDLVRGCQNPGIQFAIVTKFVLWRLIFVGPQHMTCFVTPFLRLEFIGGSQIFGQFLHISSFCFQCFFGVVSKYCPSPTDIGLRVPTRNLRSIPLFHVSASSKNCPQSAVLLRQTL